MKPQYTINVRLFRREWPPSARQGVAPTFSAGGLLRAIGTELRGNWYIKPNFIIYSIVSHTRLPQVSMAARPSIVESNSLIQIPVETCGH